MCHQEVTLHSRATQVVQRDFSIALQEGETSPYYRIHAFMDCFWLPFLCEEFYHRMKLQNLVFIADLHAIALAILPRPALMSDYFVNVAATCHDMSQLVPARSHLVWRCKILGWIIYWMCSFGNSSSPYRESYKYEIVLKEQKLRAHSQWKRKH